ncbi:MAG: anthranilate synthase component I family protein [Phycisphaerae bacterium]
MSTSWRVHSLPWPGDVCAAVRGFAGDDELAWLDSAADRGGVSVLGVSPVGVVEQRAGAAARFEIDGRLERTAASAWALWRATAAALPCRPSLDTRLGPGWIGFAGFESAAQLERLPASHLHQLNTPLLRFALFDRVVVLDESLRTAVGIEAPGMRAALGLTEEPIGAWLARWRGACTARADSRDQPAATRRGSAVFETPRPAFERMVARALEYIAAGDIYQVNLAHRIRLAGQTDPFAAHAALRAHNPAPYAAVLRWGAGAVVSASPELFLQCRAGALLTRPIKGTRPRTHDLERDAAHRAALWRSEKDAAELAMIVDLHRNDLGRVAAPGSVRVENARRIEAHPRVFHTLADIRATLAAGRAPLDALAACFPAGSISGAPKIRALQIIDELEPTARGVYTGAIGALGLDGQMTFSVAIRTVQFVDDDAWLHVGGGIVADSEPADEYAETLAKARGILEALRATDDDAPPTEEPPR